jgi:hypothetical protein
MAHAGVLCMLCSCSDHSCELGKPWPDASSVQHPCPYWGEGVGVSPTKCQACPPSPFPQVQARYVPASMATQANRYQGFTGYPIKGVLPDVLLSRRINKGGPGASARFHAVPAVCTCRLHLLCRGP